MDFLSSSQQERSVLVLDRIRVRLGVDLIRVVHLHLLLALLSKAMDKPVAGLDDHGDEGEDVVEGDEREDEESERLPLEHKGRI